MTAAETAGLALGAVLAYMTFLWLVSLALKNASIVDIFWGLGFIVAVAAYFVAGDGWMTRKLLVLVLVAVWGLRLSGYILWRNHGKGEDFRYHKMREAAGASFWWRSYFQVFLMQGLLLWVISAPLLASQHNEHPHHLIVTDVLGATVWGLGFFFEVVGDWQLARFKASPANKGKVMRYGLWRYTRHPNYFGDATLWWGLFIIAAGTRNGWMTAFGPAIMTVLLMRVSGVALLERTLKREKPEYAEYIARTSAFVPWLPKGS
jgi:steroid 5-alpha reductase family enzyme